MDQLRPETDHNLNSNVPLRLERAGALSSCRSEPRAIAASNMVMGSWKWWLPEGGRSLGRIPDHFFT